MVSRSITPRAPLIRVRWWLGHTAEVREAMIFSVSYAAADTQET